MDFTKKILMEFFENIMTLPQITWFTKQEYVLFSQLTVNIKIIVLNSYLIIKLYFQ